MIGERLEEARKRKGVSIREAAEATKIRGDFLMSMEDNSFDINLPQIYVRGFLKNYARYLHLDTQKALTDYDAQELGRKNGTATGGTTRQRRESYGSMEIDEEEESSPTFRTKPGDEENFIRETPSRLSTESANKRQSPPPPTLDREKSRDEEAYNENKVLIVKGLIAFAGIFIIGLLLFVLYNLISGSDTPEINPELAPSVVSSPAVNDANTASSNTNDLVSSESFTITASDNVTLIVEQTMDRKRLFSGSLNAGETISLEKTGPASIRFTNGSSITIDSGNQQYQPNQSGVGRTVIQ